MKKFLILLLALSGLTSLASVPLHGYIYEEDSNGKKIPLPMVNVHWAGTQTGTFTNDEGVFMIDRVKSTDMLVISYAGYEKDSLRVRPGEQSISIGLTRNIQLQKIVISARQTSTYVDHFNPIIIQHITGTELHKAACCNLGESFETNASVDVSYGDAISGAKKIELLGLTGLYTQLMIENIPDYQGFGRTFGLNYIPGHWLESISVSKGATSVLSGNESLTGQISANYKKPEGDEMFYLNLYGNNHGHLEFNANTSQKINKNLSTVVLAHGGYNNRRLDHNNDGFMDEPLTTNLHLMNRWTYYSADRSLMTHWGISALTEDRLGGQLDYQKGEGAEGGFYGFEVMTRRYGAFAKGGYSFKGRAATNLALLNNFAVHDQSSVFGGNHHQVRQISANHRAIFDTYIGNTNHIIHGGASFQYQGYDERFNDSIMNRYERIPGVFAQYTYTWLKKFTLMSGFRVDFNNLYGFQWTPRLHLRYQPYQHTTVRLSAGKGYRTTHMFSENLFLLASSRSVVFEQLPEHEIGWNYGLHITRSMKLLGRDATLNVEFFRTDFENQIIVDLDRDFEHIYVYQLDGVSFANNAQIDMTLEPIRKLDLLLAFRVSDVRSTVDGELVPLVFSKRYKGLINFSYKPGLEKWQFDFTAQFNGPSRLPENQGLPSQYQRGTTSPAYTIFNAQITKYFRHWNVYAGGENLANFVQHNPIIAADDPFGKYFDASQIWGPVLGRKLYIGMRYYFKRNQ